LRGLDTNEYIKELDTIIFGNYRFHLKLLLINNLGFFSNPLNEEKIWVKDKLFFDKFLFGLFIESIQTVEWFNIFINEMNPLEYFQNDDKEFTNNIYRLCWRMIQHCTVNVISFLGKVNEISFTNKQNFIGNILSNVPNDNIALSIPLYLNTKSSWDEYNLYHFLETALINHPDFVKSELEIQFEEHLPKLGAHDSDFIPGDYHGLHIYKELLDKHSEIAIPFFIHITRRISEHTKNMYIDEEKNEDRIFDSLAYFLYAPFKGHRYAHQEIYDLLLEYFDKNFNNDFEKNSEIVLPLLQSDLALLVNLPIICIIKNLKKFITCSYSILSTKRFYNTSSEILLFNIKNLLNLTYGLLSNDEQKVINKIILEFSPEWEKNNLFGEKGVTKYGYSRIGYTAYGYISMIPNGERKKHQDVEQFYKEKNRQFGEQKNKEPQSVEIRSGETVLSPKAYENMSDLQWKKSFRKIIEDSHFDWNKPTKIGHCRKFEESVSEKPEKFVGLIKDIIQDSTILPIYSVYGMQGLKNANFDPQVTRDIFLSFLDKRFYSQELDRESLQYSVWLIEYFIENSVIDRGIIEFLKYLVINYPDEKMLNDDPVNDGINRIRGAASLKLVLCYKYTEFAEDIFSTLEIMAKNGAVHTRAAAIYQLAYLNNLDKERNLNLFLSLMHDYDSRLLKMSLHNLHPLVYLIHVDFNKLTDFFRKAIEVEDSHKPISHVLFMAWLNGYDTSEELLDLILSRSQVAKQTIIKAAYDGLNNENFKQKCWSVLFRFLDEDDEEIGKTYEFGLHRFEYPFDETLVKFLDKYTFSKIGKYRSNYYYELLLKLSKDIPHKVITWSLAFDKHLRPNIQLRTIKNEPLQVVMLAYNAVREYDKKDNILESAMDAFDEILKIPEYRGSALEVLQKIDA
jgi:hypothetical protein